MSWGLISEMGYVGIRTPDVEASVWDAVNLLGLQESGRAGDSVFLTAAGLHHELVYTHDTANAVDRFGLVAKNVEALHEIRRRVDKEGLHVLTSQPTTPGVAEGFSFVGPEGFVFEIYTGMETAERRVGDFGPDRYGHFNFHPRDTKSMMLFLARVLDFRLSDVIGDDYAYFMRCNADHHGIAILPGQGTLHHHAWQTQSVQDLVRLGDRLHPTGRELIWGPVRHGAGHNIAAYYVETSGAVVELYTDLEQIYDDDRPPVVWAQDDNWYNMWSDRRPDDFRRFGIPPAAKH